MNLFEHLREWSASSVEWSEYVELADRFSDVSAWSERLTLGAQIAGLIESYADSMERSVMVRLGTTYTATELRAEAAEYRAGRDPHTN